MKKRFINIMKLLAIISIILPIILNAQFGIACSTNDSSYATVTQDEFNLYVKTNTNIKNSIYVKVIDKTLYPNYTTYKNYDGLIVYGNPSDYYLDNPTAYNKCTKRLEYEYLGYDQSGNALYNTYYPNVTGTTNPTTWDFVTKDILASSWIGIDPTIITYIKNAPLKGNGADNIPGFNVYKINHQTPTSDPLVNDGSPYWDLAKTQLTVQPSWTSGFSIYTVNKSGNNYYYATFNGKHFDVNLSGTLTTATNTYTINANQNEATIPATLTGNLTLNNPAKPDQIEILTAKFDDTNQTSYIQTRDGLLGKQSISTNKDFVFNRNDYPVGTHTITLTGTVLARSTFKNDSYLIRNVSKTITLVVKQATTPIATINSNVDPSIVTDNTVDTPVTVSITGGLTNIVDPSQIASYHFYARDETTGTLQNYIALSNNTSESTNFDFTINVGDLTSTNNERDYTTTVYIYLKDGTNYKATQMLAILYTPLATSGTGGSTGDSSGTGTSTNNPPIAELKAKGYVKAGENIYVDASGSSDPDGDTLSYSWDTSLANGTVTGSTGTIWFPSITTKSISVTVDDSHGGTDTAYKTIKVIAPTVDGVITASGNLKENRKVTISGLTSDTPIHYPMDWTKTTWSITPVTVGVTSNDIKLPDPNINGLSTFDVLFKKAGDYDVSMHVENTAGYTDTVTQRITIVPDLPPVADYSFVNTVYRDPDNYDYATFNLTMECYSTDGDILKNLRIYYVYDANNDGVFDEPVMEVYNGAYVYTYSFDVPKVGKYLIDIEVTEDFGQPTIAQFISPSDYKKGSTAY